MTIEQKKIDDKCESEERCEADTKSNIKDTFIAFVPEFDFFKQIVEGEEEETGSQKFIGKREGIIGEKEQKREKERRYVCVFAKDLFGYEQHAYISALKEDDDKGENVSYLKRSSEDTIKKLVCPGREGGCIVYYFLVHAIAFVLLFT